MGLKGEPPKASSFVSIKERLDASRMPFDPYALRAGLSKESWKKQRIALPTSRQSKALHPGGRGHLHWQPLWRSVTAAISIGCRVLAGSSVLASVPTTLREMASGRGKVATSRHAEDNANSMVQSARTIFGSWAKSSSRSNHSYRRSYLLRAPVVGCLYKSLRFSHTF
jgi:hypothetical protein